MRSVKRPQRKKSQSPLSETCHKGHTIFSEVCGACRAMKTAWYGKLADNDFDDIEKNGKLVDRRNPVAESPGRLIDFASVMTFEARVSYYQWCSAMAERGRFDTQRDKQIWSAHAEGTPRRKISADVNVEQSWVTRKIHQIEHSLVNQVIGSVSLADGGVFRALG